jgi:hypothetical protein
MRRAAAPFRLEVLPQPGLQCLIALVTALAILALTLALLSHFPRAWPLLALTPPAALLGWRAARIAPRCLRWDGQGWHLHEPARSGAPPLEASAASWDAPAPVKIKVIFDFGAWLLLRAQRPAWAMPIYLPLRRATQGAVWGQLRAVLYAARQSPD